ncbi:DMT family protein [Morganella morganii]
MITLTIFAIFSVTYLGENFTLNHFIGFLLIGAGALFIFKGPF